jgi:hypothetical protein
MRGNAQHFQQQESGASAKARLTLLLLNARDLDGFTAEGLARTHRINAEVAGQALEQARARRNG